MNTIDLNGRLPLVARGKVRELYELPGNKLLFIATDRISAYDVVLENGIVDKGRVLTSLSRFWFNYLQDIVPNHLADGGDVLSALPESISGDKSLAAELKNRALVVNKYRIVPLEVIVRGYITGSAWSEYQKHGTVHGMAMPTGLRESEKLPEPIYSPSTKAEQGEHDENISPNRAAEIVGRELSTKLAAIAVQLYNKAHAYALERGIIIADTKFEFGLDDSGNVYLVDEVLTPDSSRFWPKDKYEVGRGQDSFDKQYVRDWLTSHNLKGKPGVTIPEDVAEKTRQKYLEVYKKLVGP